MEVPKVLASAAVLIAPLESAAGAFCVPSKILAYLCAARPTVIAIDESNSAAQMIQKAGAGAVIPPGQTAQFVKCVEGLLHDGELRLSMGRKAREYAEATFALEKVVGRFLDILYRANSGLRIPLALSAGGAA
jgi:glycosyltransferase involved in cell wall biosynthesis